MSGTMGDFEGMILLVGNDVDYFVMHRMALAKNLLMRGLDVHVALPRRPDITLSDIPSSRLHRYDMDRASTNPFAEFKAFLQLRRLYRELSPALIHHFTIKPIMYGGIAALGTKAAVVNSVTGLGYVFTSASAWAKVIRLFSLPMLRVACKQRRVLMAFENKDDMRVYLDDKICTRSQSTILPSAGVDPTQFQSTRVDHQGTIVMVLSRMLIAKGIREFIEAARLVRSDDGNVRFVLVGGSDPNPESIPLDYLRAAQNDGIIEYWGVTNDPAKALGMADILCLPSYREGLPRSLIEGAMMGLPLIATDVPGCREVIQAGVTGFLVQARNAVALADAVKTLVADSSLRASMGSAGRELACRQFSIDAVTEQTILTYKSALANAAARHAG